MMLFWTGAACLIALALALVLPALWRPARAERAPTHGQGGGVAAAGRDAANLAILREQLKQLDAELAAGGISADQHRLSRAEIERRALDEQPADAAPSVSAPARRSTRTAAVFAVVVPAAAIGFYALVGNPAALSPEARMASQGPQGEVTLEQVEAMVASLAQRLENAPAGEPADPKAWEMLARSYAMLQRLPEADKAYARAIALAPDNAQLLVDRAEVLAMTQGQSAQGEPTKLIEQALLRDPNNLKALALAGGAAFEREDFTAALAYWTRARAMVEPASELATGLDASMAEARVRLGRAPGTASAASGAAAAAADTPASSTAVGAEAARISGEVSLAPALAGRVSPDDTVFIFARAVDGPRMPLAILKHKAGELPLRFTLDDSTAMSADTKLSKFERVVVGVRISKSGNAMPQPGDLTGQAGPVKNVASGLSVRVDSVAP